VAFKFTNDQTRVKPSLHRTSPQCNATQATRGAAGRHAAPDHV